MNYLKKKIDDKEYKSFVVSVVTLLVMTVVCGIIFYCRGNSVLYVAYSVMYTMITFAGVYTLGVITGRVLVSRYLFVVISVVCFILLSMALFVILIS